AGGLTGEEAGLELDRAGAEGTVVDHGLDGGDGGFVDFGHGFLALTFCSRSEPLRPSLGKAGARRTCPAWGPDHGVPAIWRAVGRAGLRSRPADPTDLKATTEDRAGRSGSLLELCPVQLWWCSLLSGAADRA